VNAAPNLLFAAARPLRFQAPPYDRPGKPDVLLVRWDPDGAEPGSEATRWRLPLVGELEAQGRAQPWVDGADLVRVESTFDPPGLALGDFCWLPSVAVINLNPAVLHPTVRPAVRRFDGPLLDQLLARIEAHADSATPPGEPTMSAELAALRRENAEIRARYGLPPVKPTYQPGELHAIIQNDGAGRPITTYRGHEGACWDQFAMPVRYVKRFNVPGVTL
jgi:hypothetical protein